MNARRQALLERRVLLLQRSASLRDQLTRHSEALLPGLRMADQVRAAGLWLRAHPLVPVLAAGVLWAIKPRWAWRWVSRGWKIWRLVQRTRQKVPAAWVQGVMAFFRH